jgi:SAM-dependent methyltransferase
MFSSPLSQLADRYGSDKGSRHGDRHRYAQLYDLLWWGERERVRHVVELGLAQGPHDPVLGLPTAAGEAQAASPSLPMWLEYFPGARVTGFDIADFSRQCAALDRVDFVRGDSGNPADLARLAAGFTSPPDIIIDDASHASFHQQLALRELFPALRPGGYYVIEDLHVQPDFEARLPPVHKTADWLDALRLGSGHRSSVWDDAAIHLLHEHLLTAVTFRHTQVPGARFSSALAVLRKR